MTWLFFSWLFGANVLYFTARVQGQTVDLFTLAFWPLWAFGELAVVLFSTENPDADDLD